MLKQGPSEKKILEQCRRERLPLPKSIENAPELHLGLELYYGAFMDLSSCRTGLGDGPISWQSVHEYALIYKFSEDQMEDLQYYITKMDDAFRNWRKEKDG